jgi:hypothetical protein
MSVPVRFTVDTTVLGQVLHGTSFSPLGDIAVITKIRMITLKQRNAVQLSQSIRQKRNVT